MKMKTAGLAIIAGLSIPAVHAQTVLFDFDSGPVHAGLPVTLSVGGVTAQFSSSGLGGYAIQPANSLGFTPVGFSGNCIYPSSVYAADLVISFSTTLTDVSLLYAPEEYACDSSATIQITAYMGTATIGSASTNAQAGTWPSETLRFSSTQGFNKVVVHYAAPPVTGGDWGPIFMVDNLQVTPMPPQPMVLEQAAMVTAGVFQFSFTNAPGGSFTVWASADVTLPLANWTALGAPLEISPGQYQFTDVDAAINPQRFYRVSSP